MRHRFLMLSFGALAGLAFYLLFEWLPDVVPHQASYLVLTTWALVFGIAALANAGPVSLARSVIGAGALATVMSLLMVSVYGRFGDLNAMFDTGHPIFAAIVIGFIALPFLSALAMARGSWRDYALLFNLAWGAVTRTIAACAFTGVFWGLLFLSNALLKLVGLDVIQDFIDTDGVPWVLSGAIMGIALALVFELEDYISPNLILRMLRLFLPMVLLVVLVFLVALPVRGLSNLFGHLSAAMILMGIAIVAIGLVSTALGQTQTEGVQQRAMKGMTQALAVAGACVAALAVYAVAIRVGQYGWTPERLAALTVACVTLAYGMVYTLAIAARGDWASRIRQANIRLALVVMATIAVWMTPLLNPQKIATNSQIARYQVGILPSELPLFEMQRDWGIVGRNGLEHLAELAQAADDTAVLSAIENAREAKTRYAFKQLQLKNEKPAIKAALSEFPQGSGGAEALLQALPRWELDILHRDCVLRDTANCVLITGVFQPGFTGLELLLIVPQGPKSARLTRYKIADGVANSSRGNTVMLDPDTLTALLEGEFRIAPSSANAIWVGDTEINPYN
ncbi:hypothetical protein [Algirhabdus cladophorae]|uniref:hypothetical protein n=1 Tax=Algirhabdus cladophorae TaxID=3377108 RepID=UPI003B84AE4F